ncbi:ATP-dependent RNA helicase DHX33-like [Pollicipes pollicipes]|uniref:ATP-dependent RNA helicase DHX33-like n=1 Tax=Pollicipes pollicipes TaxID=41117 RepID=UPI00188511C5|nr:ATP-dependent RNA helicase DHX33-like [Pollicipes pollicipes]
MRFKLRHGSKLQHCETNVMRRITLVSRGARLPFRQLTRQRQALPVYRLQARLTSEISSRPTLVLIGETGSGKTTQVPQFCHQAGLTKTAMVAVTQPRRVAAMSLAQRVADEMACTVGQKVGYAVRFEDCTSTQTKIKYMTDGMLLREAMSDHLLRRYSCVILDEAHERTVHTDVLFGIVKKVQKIRRVKQLPELKIIVMSATMDVDHFSRYFNSAPVIYLQGRQFPVQVYYAKQKQEDPVFASLVSVVQLHQTAPPNQDVLVFLTGQQEIQAMVKNLRDVNKDLTGCCRLRVLPLYANLPVQQQMEVFQPTPPGQRKVIVSTNVAETSVTLPNIKFVVDSGLVKARCYQPGTGLEMLRVQKISQAQAWQRTGRAGRQSAGSCYRVYTRAEFEAMPRDTAPEIQRCSLSSVALQLLTIGVRDVRNFDFLDRPDTKAIDDAMKELQLLGAVSAGEQPELTPVGRRMSAFPLDPKFAKAILASKDHGCTEEVVTIIALLSADVILLTPAAGRQEALAAHQKFVAPEGDMITLLNVFRAYRKVHKNKEWCRENYLHERHLAHAAEIRRQLLQLCAQAQLPVTSSGQSTEPVRRSLAAGLFSCAAHLSRDGHHVTVGTLQKVHIHPSSVLFMSRPACVLFAELVQTSKKYMRSVCMIDPDWLRDAAPEGFHTRRVNLET